MEIKILNPKMASYAPVCATIGSAAFDLFACIEEPVELYPHNVVKISTGIAIFLKDPNLVGIMAPRSGLATKSGIVLANTIGIIDPDYQGELLVVLKNIGPYKQIIEPFQRIAQIMILPIIRPSFEIVGAFSVETERGEGGFGSTGT